MSGFYHRQWAGKQHQAPPRKRQLVTYHMQPLSEQAGYTGQRQHGHRFGVNRILKLASSDGGDGSELISAGRDGVVRLWDVSSISTRTEEGGVNAETAAGEARCTGIFASHTDWVTGLAVAARRILASSSNDGTLKLWDLAAAQRTSGSHLRGPPGGDGDDVGAAQEGEDGRREGTQHARGIANGDRIRSGVENGAEKWRAIGGLEGIAGGGTSGSNNHSNAQKQPARGLPVRPSPLATVAGHGDYVKCLTYAPEGGVLVSGGLDKRILLWDLERMAAPLMVLHVEPEDGTTSLPGVPRDTLGGSGGSAGSDGLLPVYGEGAAWKVLRDPSRVFLRPGVAAAGPNEVLELCRQNKGSAYCVDTSVDGSLVASGGTDRMIRLLDPRAGGGRAAKVCKLDGHRDNVRCVRIDEGGTRVVSGSTDGTIRVWDVRQQHCLGVYELPGGSVWAMQPSPCDFDVYYSGGRGRRIYRTDFRTGESSLICMTNAEVLDMALELGRGSRSRREDTDIRGHGQSQSLSMWVSSTEPEITLWGGASLRRGQAHQRQVAGENATATPYDDVPASKVNEDVEKRILSTEGGEKLFSCPVGVIRGHPGVVRHVVLNNRRHVLTEDNACPPNVALWDVTKAKQVEVYPQGTIMEEKERALTEIIAVRPWFTVDTHLGTPLVSLSESSVFDGELYAVDASGERQTLLEPPPLASRQEPCAQQGIVVTTTERVGGSFSGVGGGGGRAATKGGDTGGGRTTKARSVQDEVKVNLGEAVLRGLFGRWIEQQRRVAEGRGHAHSRRRLGSGGGGRHHQSDASAAGVRRLDNGINYSSAESEDDDSDQDERESEDGSRSPPRGSRTSSEGLGSGVGVGGGRAESVASQGGSGGLRVSHGFDLDLSGSGAVGTAGRAIGDDTVLWVTETDLGGNGGVQRTILQKCVGEFDGREGEDVIPHWVTACVLHGEFHAKEQSKVSFYLAPWRPPESLNPTLSASAGRGAQRHGTSSKRGSGAGGGDGGSAAISGPHNSASQRYTAPAQMLVSKVMAYVLAHAELRQHLESVGTDGGAGGKGSEAGEGIRTPPLAAEDLVEVLCDNRVMEPHLYVGAIQQYIWSPNAGGTFFLYYRSRSRSSGEE